MGEDLLSALPLALVAVDAPDRIAFLNPAAEEWLGASCRMALGKPLSHYLLIDEALRALIDQVRERGVSATEYDYALSQPPPQARTQWATLHLFPLPHSGLALAIDTGAGLRMQEREKAVREEVRLSSGLMSAMLAHEVKNPLAGIRGAAQLLARDVTDAVNAPLLALIRDEVDRIQAALLRVEPFSDHLPPAKDRVNIHELLHYVQGVARASEGEKARIAFVERYDPSLPEIISSRDALVQILLNLVRNAMEALAETPDPRIALHTGWRQAHLVIAVEDNGPGISPDIRLHLFDPFLTTKGTGRGLGLAISAKLAADLGMKLEVEESETGARFCLLIPV